MKYQWVPHYNEKALHALLEEQCINIWEKEGKAISKGIS